MEELLNKLKSLNAIRALGSYSDYDPEDVHKDTIYFAEDLKKIYLNGEDYGGITSEQYNELIRTLNNKVEKVNGKLLSTEDFTADLKAKLEGLTNYDDKTLTNEINSLKSRLNTILDSDNTTTVIDTFQEIESFLQGITNTETLTGLLQDLKEDIVLLCANNYLHKSGGVISGDTFGPLTIKRIGSSIKGSGIKIENEQGFLGAIGIGGSDSPVKNDIYFSDANETDYKILHSGNYSSTIYSGTSSQFLKADGSVDETNYLPIVNGVVSVNRVNSLKDDNILLAYKPEGTTSINTEQWGVGAANCEGVIRSSDSDLQHFRNTKGFYKIWDEYNDGAESGLDADMLDGKHSNKFFTVGSFTGPQFISVLPFGMHYNNSDATSGHDQLGFPQGYGVLLNFKEPNSNYGLQIHCGSNSKLEYKLNFGNNNQNWKEISTIDSNVASSDKLKSVSLTNEDLNQLSTTSFISYYAVGGNTCINKPDNVDGFHLLSFATGAAARCLILVSFNDAIYKRFGSNTTWNSWVKMADINSNVASSDKLITKLLTDEDLNNLKDSNYSSYYANAANTCANKPKNISSFNLQVLKLSDTYRSQILIAAYSGEIYKRYWNTSTWSEWQKMLTEDDAATKLSTKQLMGNDLDDIKDKNFSSYWASGENQCTNKPDGVDGFGLYSYRIANAWYGQTLISANALSGNTYKRYYNLNGTWSPWKKIFTEDDIYNLITRIEQLESQINS